MAIVGISGSPIIGGNTDRMTKAILERDLQQLKNTLAEAGIDVGRFDLAPKTAEIRVAHIVNNNE